MFFSFCPIKIGLKNQKMCIYNFACDLSKAQLQIKKKKPEKVNEAQFLWELQDILVSIEFYHSKIILKTEKKKLREKPQKIPENPKSLKKSKFWKTYSRFQLRAWVFTQNIDFNLKKLNSNKRSKSVEWFLTICSHSSSTSIKKNWIFRARKNCFLC
jgi:hypothetical protein